MATALHRRYPGDPASAKAARDDLAEMLRDCGRDDMVAVATLLADELVANAVIHADGPVVLDAHCSGAVLRVVVEDGGGRGAVARDRDLSGRGLVIVEALASSWGYDPNPAGGRSTWFELRADETAPPQASGIDEPGPGVAAT